MTSHLYGVHDASADWASIIRDAGMTGWAVQSEGIGDNPNDRSGGNYGWLSAYGVTPIVRLNYSHHGEGTLPLPDRYDAFAARCANFVTASSGCTHWVIANEPNLNGERCQGVPITARQYADCFKRCRNAIKQRGLQHLVMPAAVAPYNVDTGWCMDYWREMLGAIAVNNSGDAGADGLTIHTYSRGPDPNSIYSEDKMDAPYQAFHNGFRAYQDFLSLVPAAMKGLPIYVTETDQNVPWADRNSGWVGNAYQEINEWNKGIANQKISALVLYRWKNYDQWVIQGKNGVIDDFRAAVARGYQSPTPGNPGPTPPNPTPPNPTPPTPEPPEPTPIEWDPRLTVRGCTLQPSPTPTEIAPIVGVGRWFNEQEAQGRVNIFVRLLDENGQLAIGVPVTLVNGNETKPTERKSDPWLASMGLGAEYSLDFAMYNVAPAYGIRIEGYSGDVIDGCGLGSIEAPHHTIHTAYFFEWRLAKATIKPPDPGPAHTQYVTALAGANLRAEPVTGAVMVAVPYGEAVTVDGSQMGSDGYEWKSAIYEWYKGWIRADLLSATKPQPPEPPIPPEPGRGHLIWPVQNARITQRFGDRYEYYQAHYDAAGHNGLDFGLAAGSPIYATADGIVTMAGDDTLGYGLFCRLYHPSLRLGSLYAHCSELLVAEGDIVQQGQQIATVGSTGNSTGAHCHWELCAQDESGYVNVSYGHTKGRCNPEVVMWLMGKPAVYR